MQLLPVFNNISGINDMKSEIEKNFVTLFSLDQITLGLNITKTIAGFIMQSVLQLIQAHSFDEHIIFVIDEVSVIENPIIDRFLSEARKYNLSLILAGQYFDQISKELQNSIFTNVINYFIFRVSRMDAIILEKNMKMESAVKNSSITRIKMIAELNDRECIVRIGENGRLQSAFKAKTTDFIPVPRIKMNKENEQIKIEKKKELKTFDIKTTDTLKDIMIKQSGSRKRLNFEGGD